MREKITMNKSQNEGKGEEDKKPALCENITSDAWVDYMPNRLPPTVSYVRQ